MEKDISPHVLLSGDYYTDPYVGSKTYQVSVGSYRFTGTTEWEAGMKRKRIKV